MSTVFRLPGSDAELVVHVHDLGCDVAALSVVLGCVVDVPAEVAIDCRIDPDAFLVEEGEEVRSCGGLVEYISTAGFSTNAFVVGDQLASVFDDELLLGNVFGGEEAVATAFELGLANKNCFRNSALKGDVLAAGGMELLVMSVLRICAFASPAPFAKDGIAFSVELDADTRLPFFLSLETSLP